MSIDHDRLNLIESDLDSPRLARYRITEDIDDLRWLVSEARRLDGLLYLQQRENAEHRAARGIEAPEGWEPSTEALWDRMASDKRCRDEDGVEYDECPDGCLVVADAFHEDKGWHWAWYIGSGNVKAEGYAPTCLGAIAAAETALKEGA